MNASRDNWEQHWEQYHHSAEENPAQRYRRDMVFELLGLKGRGEGVRLLDIGSGQGDAAASVLSHFPAASVLGLELSHSGVEISRRKVPGARFVQRDLLEPAQVPEECQGWATHAICSEVIEHLDDPAVMLENARHYMASGCLLAVTAPGGPMSAFDRHIGHRRHWQPQELETLLQHSGYVPERISGAGFPFFNLYRCLVLVRGRKLIDDVAASPSGTSSLPARAAMAVFSGLIRPGLNSSHWGWQRIGRARVP